MNSFSAGEGGFFWRQKKEESGQDWTLDTWWEERRRIKYGNLIFLKGDWRAEKDMNGQKGKKENARKKKGEKSDGGGGGEKTKEN